jgi:two-component system NtrC family sensor kinase
MVRHLPSRVLHFFRQVKESLHSGEVLRKLSSLKVKISLFIILVVASVLFLSSYLDFRLAKKAQIDLYLDRNLYIAKQIDIGIPALRIMANLPRVHDEIEEWLLSRPSLTEIQVFLFTAKGWERVASQSVQGSETPMALTRNQINDLKKDNHFSTLMEVEGEERLEVVVPLHAGARVVGGVRVISSLNEVQSYLNQRVRWTLILTLSSIFLICIMLFLLFKGMVGNPIKRLIEAMSKAEKGNLEAEVSIQSHDELGELGRHFDQMIKTIRETHDQNIQLLSQVNRFNEELTEKIQEATSELARRNEELKLLNEALLESQRQLGQSEKLAALGQVTAMMAHQIGTPLNSISGYIQLLLQDGALQSPDRDRLKIIESQLDRLADSVRNLLTSTSQPKRRLKLLNVAELLEELFRLSEPWFRARNVKLFSSFSPNLPSVLGDPVYLQTLFLNLITNALDAMTHGGSLTVKAQQIPSLTTLENGKWLEISITDTGIGIPEESKKKIFDPFFTTKKVGDGTGLGLSICEKIVRDHSGRLEVKSEVGKGSTFLVLLPVHEGKEKDEQITHTSPDRR